MSFRGLSSNNKVSRVNKVCLIKDRRTGEILEVSNIKSRLSRLRRRVFSWSRTMPAASQTTRLVMITVTYRKAWLWMPNQIKAFMAKIRKELRGNLRAYAWVAELQERGAVHYHVLLMVNRGTSIPQPDKAGWWRYGMTKIQTINSPFYIAKYTGKEYQKVGEFPRGLRLFAVWIAPDSIDILSMWKHRLTSLPRWLQEVIVELPGCEGGKWARAPGGGWLFEGRLYTSPYEFMRVEYS